MKLAFTLCSNNYLAQAKTLGDSLLKFNPDYKFVIGLVDKFSPQINYSKDITYEIIPIEDIGIADFDNLWKKYNIIELNTCIKPSIIRYLFKKNPDLEFLFFFDPDIMIFDKLSDIESKFKMNDFILTPHILYPLTLSEQRPNEYDFLNYGIYNIGFLGLRNSKQVINDFLPWWEERALKLGYIKPCSGLFVDQIWFNLVPLFFRKTYVLNHLGCNVGPWNLHERELTQLSDRIIVNSKDNLIFFHFSSYNYNRPATLFYNYDRNINYINSTIEYLYTLYNNLLIENRIERFSAVKCYYMELKEKLDHEIIIRQNTLKRRVKKLIKNLLPVFIVNRMNKTIQ